MKLAVGRAGATVEITVQSRFVETRAGQPVEARSELNMGGTPLVGQAVFTDTAIAYTVRQGDGAPGRSGNQRAHHGHRRRAAGG